MKGCFRSPFFNRYPWKALERILHCRLSFAYLKKCKCRKWSGFLRSLPLTKIYCGESKWEYFLSTKFQCSSNSTTQASRLASHTASPSSCYAPLVCNRPCVPSDIACSKLIPFKLIQIDRCVSHVSPNSYVNACSPVAKLRPRRSGFARGLQTGCIFSAAFFGDLLNEVL